MKIHPFAPGRDAKGWSLLNIERAAASEMRAGRAG